MNIKYITCMNINNVVMKQSQVCHVCHVFTSDKWAGVCKCQPQWLPLIASIQNMHITL